MTLSYWRGHKIEFNSNKFWLYFDTKEKVSENNNRECGHCHKNNREDGHDTCIGELPGLMNACCGHGKVNGCYVQFLDGSIVSGENAKIIIDRLSIDVNNVKLSHKSN